MANKIITAISAIIWINNWPLYFKDYFKMNGRKYSQYNLRNGIKFILRANSNDRATFNEIFIHKTYNPKGFEIKNKEVIVDIGAHIGFFSIYAAKNAKNGKVFSFEPSKENYILLDKNVKLNNLSNIKLFNSAVSGKDGKIEFNISKNNLCHSIYEVPRFSSFIR